VSYLGSEKSFWGFLGGQCAKMLVGARPGSTIASHIV